MRPWAGRAAPATAAVSVTPHDTNDLTRPSRALYVGGTGDVSVIMDDGTTVTFVGVQAGSFLPIVVTRVRSTGTTATSILTLN